MLELKKGRYVSRVWMFGKVGADFDVFMTLSRLLPDGRWDLQYRFRYYEDDKSFDSKDRRSETHFSLPGSVPEAAVLEKIAIMVTALSQKTGLPADEVVIESDEPAVYYERTKDRPWSHVRFERVEAPS